MTDGIGRPLWEIYEDAVRKERFDNKGGVAGATLKFIEAFERELEAANIDIYNKSALEREISMKAKFRR